jgi:16S rRNA (uracil1498-N3)-methyltransferase
LNYRIVIDPAQKQNQKIVLNSEQFHYLTRVLRKTEGDLFIAMDGKGQSWLAKLVDTWAEIIEAQIIHTEIAASITLMSAIPKGGAFDEIVRCCTELGVTSIIPIVSDRVLVQPSQNKLQRWRKIAKEAAEQSERQIVPDINEPIDFDLALNTFVNSQIDAYICTARGEVPHLLSCLQNKRTTNLIIATGPEGGWTSRELAKALDSGLQPVSLGKRILRAVTAPIVVLGIVSSVIEAEKRII